MMAPTIVAIEPGSEWPCQIGDATEIVGLGPTGDDLLRRTEERLDVLHRGKRLVRVAVLACNAATGGEAMTRRKELARRLLAAVARSIHGRLILSASDLASEELRRELFTLSGELTGELRGSRATVSLWFAEPSHGRARYLPGTRTRHATRASA